MNQDTVNTFEKIYEVHSDAIFRFCLVRVSNREQALDITQETFLRLWKTLLEDTEVVNTKAFLFTIARRLIIDWYRKKKSMSLDSMIEAGEEALYEPVDEKTLDNLDLGPEGRYLLDKIGELSHAYQQPVYLRFVEGLSPAEIGEVLGISANAAGVRVNRGLVELREKTGYNIDEDKDNE